MSSQLPFTDRREAGRLLGGAVARRGFDDAVVLALPRGGVPVAYEVAMVLGLPLDVLCVRKLGVPFQPELAMGAIASGGAVVRNDDVLALVPDAERAFATVLEREREELARRERAYRGDAPPLDVRGRMAIVVDDGLATGATMEAAARAVQMLKANPVVVAVPVASPEAVERIVTLRTPLWFGSVGQWYDRFDQTDDAEVTRLLAAAARARPAGGA